MYKLNLPQNAIQSAGTRPKALPLAIRQSIEWESLRRKTISHAVRMRDDARFDFREILTEAKNIDMAGQLMWQLIRPYAPEVLVGPGFGVAPLLFGIASTALRTDNINLHILMVRDKRKEHNRKRWIEGNFDNTRGKRAILVDDFMGQGSALATMFQALTEEKVQLNIQAFALFFDMWTPHGSRQISLKHFPVEALYTRHDIGLSRDAFDAVPPTMSGHMPALIDESPTWWRMALNHSNEYQKKCVPVIANGRIFVADDQSTLWCHELTSGEVIWSLPSLSSPQKGVVQMLQAAEDSVVYACYDGTVTRVNQLDGQIIWRWRIDSSIHATPYLDLKRNRVFINTEQWNEGSPTGHVQCLAWDTGLVHWRYWHAWWPPSSPIYCESLDLVFAHCNDKTLIALQASTGQQIWQTTTSGLVRGQPALCKDRLYSATENGWLECADAANGELLWTKRYGKGLDHAFLRVASTDEGDVILALDGKWHWSAFDAKTGELRWLTRLRSVGCWSPVPIDSQQRFWAALSRDGHIAVVDVRCGVKLWEAVIRGQYFQPPAIGDGYLVAASNHSGLLAYRLNPEYLD